MVGDKHWTPNGGSIAECGELVAGKLTTTAMSGVNCPVCLGLVIALIDAIRPGYTHSQVLADVAGAIQDV